MISQRLRQRSAPQHRLGRRWGGGSGRALVALAVLSVHAASADTTRDTASADTAAKPCDVVVLDAAGRVLDADGAFASIERTPPEAPSADDPDARIFVVRGPASALPTHVSVQSFARGAGHARGEALDTLASVKLEARDCPAGSPAGVACAATPPVRVVMDAIDRDHALVKARSVVGVLDGTVVVEGPGVAARALDVRGPGGGPTLLGGLHVRVLRLAPGGAPSVGTSDGDAAARVEREVHQANLVWAQCGVRFGDDDAGANGEGTPARGEPAVRAGGAGRAGRLSVRVDLVDPPPPHLVAVGCDRAMPASGGSIAFNVERKSSAGGAPERVGIALDVPAGTTPAGAARRVARAVRKAGFVAVVSDGAAATTGTYAPSDVSIRNPDGSLATVVPPGGDQLSSDPTLAVCVGRVTLDDGLDHFDDATAAQGSLEERALVRAFDDGDPSTLDVYVVPSFVGESRIGESFIAAEHAALTNVVIEDRAGFRAGVASFTLGHELGHVLLDDPGHPDDYADDTPALLMDSDSASATAFGPRRLPLDACARMIVEAGPDARIPLLERSSGRAKRAPSTR